ncbi:MAG: exo-beta-N-acetylmuramidase NamZ domain-containing protein, partial [Planctomycetota bacterium]
MLALLLGLFISPPTSAEPHIRLGIDVLAGSEFEAIRGQRVGLVAHPASVAGDLTHSVDVLRAGADAGHFTFVAMFGTEHGVYGDIYAGDKVADKVDPRSG